MRSVGKANFFHNNVDIVSDTKRQGRLMARKKQEAAAPTRAAAFGEEQLRSLGRRLRQLREARNWSLKKLATESGISIAAIQKIEVGEANPSLLTVLAITEVLGEPVDRLIEASRELGRAVNCVRGTLPARAQEAVALATELAAPQMEAHLIPVGTKERFDLRAHGIVGPAFAYVLDGTVEIDQNDGATPRVLRSGDAVHLDADVALALTGQLARRSQVLCLADRRESNDSSEPK